MTVPTQPVLMVLRAAVLRAHHCSVESKLERPVPAAFSVLLLCVVAAVGCGGALSKRAAEIRISDPHGVESCTFLGDVQGVAGVLSVNPPRSAKRDALEIAARKGATDLVWVTLRAHDTHGRAYRCGPR